MADGPKRKAKKGLMRSKLLIEQVATIDKDGGREDLVVGKNETRVLSYTSKSCRHYYREIKVSTLEDIKDVIGAPDTTYAASCATSAGIKKPFDGIDRQALCARIGEVPAADDDPQKTADEFRLVRAATHDMIYGDSRQIQHWRPAVDQYLKMKHPRIFVPFFFDIVVYAGGTLTIAANTLAVYANRIRLYGTGRIDCEGPTTFDCTSFEGQLAVSVVAGAGAP